MSGGIVKIKTLIILALLSLTTLSAYSQSRSPAVENEIIIETESGTQTKQFLEAANAKETPMNALTLISLLAFMATPFGIYLIIERQSTNRKTRELQENVVLMSEYQKRKEAKSKNAEAINDDDDDDFSDQAA